MITYTCNGGCLQLLLSSFNMTAVFGVIIHLLPSALGFPDGFWEEVCLLSAQFCWCFLLWQRGDCCLIAHVCYTALFYAARPWGIDSLIHFALRTARGWEDHRENSGDLIIPHLKFCSTNRLWSSSWAWAPLSPLSNSPVPCPPFPFLVQQESTCCFILCLFTAFIPQALLVVPIPAPVTRALTGLHHPLPGCLFSHWHANASLSSHL